MSHPPSASLHRVFEAQAARVPDAVAVTCGDDSLTYRALDARANQLAHALRALGVNTESLVGLLLDRSLDLVVGVLGILKAGGAYVPVDVTNPAERAAGILEDAGVPVVVTRAAFRGMLPGTVVRTIDVDRDADTLRTLPSTSPGAEVSSANAAYVIYTSGSTGKPKGVVVEHGNVVRLFEATRPWFQFDSADVWTLFHSIAFDFSVWELWGPLLHAGRLVVVPQRVTRSPEEFHDLLAAERVTVLNQTPSAFRMLVQVDESTRADRALSLRHVIFGGEALTLESLRSWINRHGDDRPQLINMYGITETTVHVTYRRIRSADLDRRLGSVIGEPIPDLRFYLLDDAQQPVPDGVPGEIYVGGAGVARGYLNRPDLTAQRFFPDPFAVVPGTRMYRSGDQARRLPDGDVEYLGRLDTQVKIRGFRVEVGEIEALVLQSGLVGEVVVDAREVTPGEMRLVAYYTAKTGAVEPAAAALRALLAERLPEHMVPSHFVPLREIPLTPNGKTDRRALPDPGRRRPALDHPMVAPRTPVEAWIARHWSEVLNMDEVGVYDRFFELGGNSIMAVRLLGRLSHDAGTSLPALLLFRAPTVAQMAAILEQEHGGMLPASLERAGAVPRAISESAAERAAHQRDALRDRRARRRHTS